MSRKHWAAFLDVSMLLSYGAIAVAAVDSSKPWWYLALSAALLAMGIGKAWFLSRDIVRVSDERDRLADMYRATIDRQVVNVVNISEARR